MASDHLCDPVCGACRAVKEQGRTRVAPVFPSLELMARPITPALPRITPFAGSVTAFGLKYRCRIELKDVVRRKSVPGLSLSDYAAPAAEGWGNTPERAYQAWKTKWMALNK